MVIRHPGTAQDQTCGVAWNVERRPEPVPMDPFEVRIQFLSLIRKLNASVHHTSRLISYSTIGSLVPSSLYKRSLDLRSSSSPSAGRIYGIAS